MAYTYNGDIVSSVLECGRAMYDKFLDKNENFHSGGTNQEGEVFTWNDVYIGIGKRNYYYYRYYGATRNVPGSLDDYSLLFDAFRPPFNINDDIIRPFFIKPKDNHAIYSLHVGVKEDKGDWNFNNNRYGNVNNSIDTSLLDNTSYATRIFAYSVKSGYNNDNTINCSASGVEKTRKFSVIYREQFKRYTLDITQNGFLPSVYAYGYGYHTDDENFYAYTQDTNIPCFNEED